MQLKEGERCLRILWVHPAHRDVMLIGKGIRYLLALPEINRAAGLVDRLPFAVEVVKLACRVRHIRYIIYTHTHAMVHTNGAHKHGRTVEL